MPNPSLLCPRANNDLAEAALSRLAMPILVLDDAGIIVSKSAAAEELLGKHVIGESIASLLVRQEALGATSAASQITGDWIRTSTGSVLPASIEPLGGSGFLVTIDTSPASAEAADRQVPDDLTGLPRRRELTARLTRALAEARRNGLHVAVHCLDLDRFKFVNDTLGHPMGDALLKKVVQRVRSACRKDDIVARIGGDEFVVVQHGISDLAAAEGLAARLVDLVGRTYVLSGHTVNIGVSIGVVASDAAADPESLLRSGDVALYQAKSGGRGRFAFFEPGMDTAMQERRELEIELRRAGAEGVRARLPAADRYCDRPDRRLRGSAPLEPPEARSGAAACVHPVGRGNRSDRSYWRVGYARQLVA